MKRHKIDMEKRSTVLMIAIAMFFSLFQFAVNAEIPFSAIRLRKPEKGSFEDWRFDITGIEGQVFLSSKKYWSFK